MFRRYIREWRREMLRLKLAAKQESLAEIRDTIDRLRTEERNTEREMRLTRTRLAAMDSQDMLGGEATVVIR